MDCKINMKAISGSLRKFNVYESSSEFMIVASEKFEKEYHIIRIDKKSDLESLKFNLEGILNEEVHTFTKEEYLNYMAQLKDQKSFKKHRESVNSSFRSQNSH
jgi:hypothetical protein